MHPVITGAVRYKVGSETEAKVVRSKGFNSYTCKLDYRNGSGPFFLAGKSYRLDEFTNGYYFMISERGLYGVTAAEIERHFEEPLYLFFGNRRKKVPT